MQSTIDLHIETPLIESVSLSKHLGISTYLKLDAFQPSGSFKNRGIGYLCRECKNEGKKLFISSSGGNAGLAVAYSGRKLHIPVKVIIPKTTPLIMQEKIKAEGAEVIIHGENWNEADTHARKLCTELNAAYISPFNHPLIWKGHSSIIHEIKQSGYKPEAVLLSVGGGGLYCGIIEGLKEVGWHDVAVITAETEGASSFYQTVQANSMITLDQIHTIATSLGAKRVADQAFQYSKEHSTFPQIVSDEESLMACFRFAKDHRILVEPACGAMLSLIYQKHPILKNYNSILAIVCGGNSVNFSLLQQWSKHLGIQYDDYL